MNKYALSLQQVYKLITLFMLRLWVFQIPWAVLEKMKWAYYVFLDHAFRCKNQVRLGRETQLAKQTQI
jgi:hypothetical protein